MSASRFSGLGSLPTRGEVLEALFALWHPDLPAETISVEDALGRVTAGECRSRLNLPVVRASSGDGIAVDSERFRDGVPDTSGWEMGRDFVRADTGDDFDDRFDAVIMIEDVDIGEGGRLRIRDGVTVRKGDNVRPSGSTVREGELLAPKHVPLRPRDLACLHLGGVWDVPVLRKPAVAFIPTGNELVPPRSAVVRGKNVDTNSVLARTSLQLLGAEPLLYPIVPDDRAMLGRTLDGDLPGADKISLLCSLDVRLGADGGYVAHPIDFRQSSSARTAAANAQYMTSLGGPPPRAGDRIVVELLREPGSIVRS